MGPRRLLYKWNGKKFCAVNPAATVFFCRGVLGLFFFCLVFYYYSPEYLKFSSYCPSPFFLRRNWQCINRKWNKYLTPNLTFCAYISDACWPFQSIKQSLVNCILKQPQSPSNGKTLSFHSRNQTAFEM